MAQTATIVTTFDRLRNGREVVAGDPRLGTAANFLYTLTGKRPDDVMERAFDIALILHADHELNASTFAARVTASTLSDIYSAVTSAIGTLKGPLHGGANEGVIKMLQDIGSPDKVDAYVEECLEQKKKIMGIGHRIYKTLDPRAPHLKRMAQILSANIGEPKCIQMRERIAPLMLEKKRLPANADLHWSTVYISAG